MYQIVLVIHVLVSVAVIGLVLIQQGKGATAGASFGGGSSGTVFGARGAASFLSRATSALTAVFFVTSLALAFFGVQATNAPESALERAAVETAPTQQQSEVPAVPEGIVVTPVPSAEVPVANDEVPSISAE